MKDVIKRLSGFVFYAIAIAILAWTVSLTWDVLSNKVLPGQPEKAIAGMVMFDAGMVGWLITFLFRSKGLTQRAIAIGLSGISLIGMGAMAFADLFLAGQDLAAIPASLGTMVIWGIGVMTFIHVLGIWGYHLSDPDTVQEIILQTEEDKIVGEALKQTQANLEASTTRLAARISARMEDKALYRLGLLESGDVIDAQAKDPEPHRKRHLFSKGLIIGRPRPVQPSDNGAKAEAVYPAESSDFLATSPAANPQESGK